MLSTGEPKSKVDLLDVCKKLVARGYNLFATRGTQSFLEENNVSCIMVHWGDEKAQPNVITMINNNEFDLVINIPKDQSLDELNNDFLIRRTAVDRNIPLLTNGRLAAAFLDAVCEQTIEDININSWDEYK